MRVAIVGVGAVGGVIAGSLARAGVDIVAVARGDHARAIDRQGLRFRDLLGRLSLHRLETRLLDDVPIDCDLVIVALKAHQTMSEAASLIEFVGDRPSLVVQNGLPWWYLDEVTGGEQDYIPGDSHTRLRERNWVTMAGIARFGAAVIAPGEVHCTGPGELVLSPRDKISGTLAETLRDVSAPADLAISVVQDPGSAIWSKLVVNVPLNALAVLTGAPIRDILTNIQLEMPLARLAGEVSQLAAGLGVDAALDLDCQRSSSMPGQKSSTLIDLERGREIEFAALFESTVWLSNVLGIDLPLVRLTASLVQARAGLQSHI